MPSVRDQALADPRFTAWAASHGIEYDPAQGVPQISGHEAKLWRYYVAYFSNVPPMSPEASRLLAGLYADPWFGMP